MANSCVWSLLILAGLAGYCVNSADWSYTGLDHWGDDYPDCTMASQSPINIVTADAEVDPSYAGLTFEGYSTAPAAGSLTLKHTGHGVQVDVSATGIGISNSRLPAEYELVQFHWHWGNDDNVGSEHEIDGSKKTLEVHFVHYNKMFEDVGSAVDQPNGLAVVGVLYEVGTANDAFDNIVNNLAHVNESGKNVSVDSFALMGLFPSDRDQYYRYNGSLTTPPCYESVVWTVMATPATVSAEQMTLLRDALEGAPVNSTDYVTDNFRHPQPLGNRTVVTNMGPTTEPMTTGTTESTGGAPALGAHLLLTGLLAVLCRTVL